MTTQANFGWMGPDSIDIWVTNRTGSAVPIGDLELLDIFRSDAASTTNYAGATTSGVANAVVPIYDATTHPFTLACGIVGIAISAASADDREYRMRLRGPVDVVRCDTTASTGNNVTLLTDVGIIGDGTEAAVIISAQITIDGNAQATLLPRKVVFLPLTARTGAGTTNGLFDGIHGFGFVLSTVDVT